MSSIDREKASGVNHEWQTQALAAASTSNAQFEGDDATTKAVTARVRLGNYLPDLHQDGSRHRHAAGGSRLPAFRTNSPTRPCWPVWN
jgi:hypothetical protein